MTNATDILFDLEVKLDTARQLRIAGDHVAALDISREIFEYATKNGETLLAADVLCDIGGSLCFTDPNAAFEPLQDALHRFEQIGNPSRIARAHGRIGNLHRIQGRVELALEHYLQGMKIFREIQETDELLILLGNLAGFLYEYHRPEEAETYLKEAIDLARVVGDRDKETWYLTIYAKELQLACEDELAVTKIEHAQRLAESLGDPQLLANIQEAKAFIYLLQQDYNKALGYLNYLLNFFGKKGDPRFLSGIQISTADCLRHLGDFDAAENHYRKALESVRKMEDVRGQTTALEGLAEIEYVRGEFDAAYHNYHHAAELYRNIDDRLQAGIIHSRLSYLCRDMNHRAEAKAMIESAISTFRTLNERQQLALALLHYADLLIDDGEFAVANELIADAAPVLNWEKLRTSLLDALIPMIRIGYLLETGRVESQLTIPPQPNAWRLSARKAIDLVAQYHILPSDRSVLHLALFRTELLAAGIPEAEIPVAASPAQ